MCACVCVYAGDDDCGARANFCGALLEIVHVPYGCRFEKQLHDNLFGSLTIQTFLQSLENVCVGTK